MQAIDTATAAPTMRIDEDAASRAGRALRDHRKLWLKRVRQALLGLLLAAATALTTLALLPKPVPVDVAHVTRGSLSVEVHETGQTRVKDRYVVSAPTAGSLLRVALETNDPVQEGAPLAQIAPTPSPLLDPRSRAEAEARLAAAVSALKHADAQLTLANTASELSEVELRRANELGKVASLPEQAVDQARFSARMRQGEVASATFARKIAVEQVRLARASLQPRTSAADPIDVLSPVSGNVLRVQQVSAGVVAAGTPLLEVGDLAALEVVVDLLTTDAVQLRPGTPVVIEGWGGERGLAGRVRKVELAAFTRLSALGVEEQRANTIVVFDEPREQRPLLGDGYRVEVRLMLWQGHNIVKLPQGAVFRRGDGWAAFRVHEGVAQLVALRLGHRGDTEIEVVAGLQPGDAVVMDPGDRVEPGVRIEPR